MKLIFFAFWFTSLCVLVIPAKHRSVLMIDKNYVCHIKRSCLECLKLPHCSWCPNESKCYSEQLVTQKGYCENSAIHHIEYGKCLKLPHCSWCPNESKCYSEQLMTQKGYCENSAIHHIEYGMSITENAECSCAGGNMEKNCVSPGKKEECSGPDRGKCICGRCFCNPNPDPDNSTKAVMGEYCEYDNFSCNGAKCNEGPYNIYEQKYDEENQVPAESDITEPSEE